MPNALVHQIETVDGLTVETVEQLRDALSYLVGQDDFNLSHSYRVELLAERLSDGSKAYEISIRKAEAV